MLGDVHPTCDYQTFKEASERLESGLGNRKLATDIRKYVLSRNHPRHWTVFGNRSNYPDSLWEDEYFRDLGAVYGVESPYVNDSEKMKQIYF